MQKTLDLSLLPQCRLCGFIGHHKINIFEGDSGLGDSNVNVLSEKIFRCVEVRVERSDETTKICGKCFCKIYDFARFRELCAATDQIMQETKRRRAMFSGDVIDEVNPMPEVAIETENSLNGIVSQNRKSCRSPLVEFISLIDEESGGGEMDALREIATSQTTSLSDERSAATKRGHDDINADFHESPKRQKRGPDCSATMIRKSPETDSSTSRRDDSAQLATDIGEITNRPFDIHGLDSMTPPHQEKTNESQGPTRESRNCDPVSKSIDMFEAFSEDETDSDSEIITVSVQDINRRPQNGNFSKNTEKRTKNELVETVSSRLIKCRSRGVCEDTFENWDAMMFHVANYHAKGKKTTFCCHLCKKTFATRTTLQKHMNAVHNREIRFMCPIRSCAKIFTQKCGLERHTNAVHTKAVAFKCAKCPMKFYRKDQLTTHMANTHGKGITFSCYLCKKQLSSKQKLQMHMNVLHTGQASFKCPFPNCSKSFTQKSDLNRHTNAIHTKKNVFKCTKCDMEFYWKSNLTRHAAKMH